MFDLIPDEFKLAALLTGALLCTAAGAAGAWTVQGWRLDAVKAEYAAFVAQVKAAGEAAEKIARQQQATDQQRKEQADVENKHTLDALNADIKRLRHARASGGFVPAAPAAAGRPDLACFDRAELEQSIRALDTSVQGIADQGSAATVNLDSAKRWAANSR